MDWLPVSLVFILEWASRIAALLIVPRRRLPTAGMAWLLFIFFIPLLGWIGFLILGNYKLPKQRRELQLRSNEVIDGILAELHARKGLYAKIVDPPVNPKWQSVVDLTYAYSRFPSLSGNTLSVIDEYDEIIDRICKDIDAATQQVYVEYYIFTLDTATQPLIDALARAKQRGIDVRVLYDSWGSRKYTGRKAMIAAFEAADIPYRAMLPLQLPGRGYVRPDLRNHRKIVTIDGSIGYTGSQNLIERHYERKDEIYYDELVVRVTGPIVGELSALFETDWQAEGGEELHHIVPLTPSVRQSSGSAMQVLPSGPGYPDENNLKIFTHIFHLAEKSLVIVNPYFIPPESMVSALITAAHRGVHVTMINSASIDQVMVGYAQRSYYDTLLQAGVEIYLYKAPVFLHSKFMVVDDELVVVGSSNMDMRSFELDSELSLLCYDKTIAKQMTKAAKMYQKRSSKLTLKEWRKRPISKQFIENITRLTSALQ